ncbi:UDP-glycosyltransferase 86A1 [Striga hermonthica]|uniref:UDP-glycosyltransferase 86A1 n=1 Tax=Striga hermonthica TaxID=68872 RepID=A0A9N7NI36_STRHE|nr:UDP-glycosyltransferase 86A1 [Striga hermonthica]
MGKQSKGHAIMISLPYQGHINPFTNLALKLASKGFTVTFVHLEFVHHKLSKAHHSQEDLFSEARKSGFDLRYATIDDGFPLEFDREANRSDYWDKMLHDFPARVDEFVGKMVINQRADQCPVRYFLATDTVFPWPATIADKYNLVNVSFWTEPALVFSLLYHWDLLSERGHFPCPENASEINYIPGVKPINARDLMSYLKEADLDETVNKMLSLAFEEVKKADFTLHNTVEELESDTLAALDEYQPNYAIGPINFSKILLTNGVSSQSLWSESDCSEWLVSKSPGSVLYVSFGSCVTVSKHIIDEIAYGLILSGVNFIWVDREGILGSFGFEIEIKDKGLVVPWCDQIKVLSSPAVGGFLTHNGWNSTVESMWCGVPMICCPIAWDQTINRKLVVDDWGNGISICDGESINRGEVAEKVKSFMGGSPVSKRVRADADKAMEAMRKALGIDGSSERNFDRLVRDLEAKIQEKAMNVEK